MTEPLLAQALEQPLAILDPVLRGFFGASGPAGADQALAALLNGQAVPLIRRVAARKLRSFGDDGASFDDDLQDITSDVLVALVSRLQSLRRNPAARPIASFDNYTAAVTFNAFTEYLRRRHPQRSRLKNRLRYVLTRHGRFGLWPTTAGLACGLATWRPREPRAEAAHALKLLATEPERWGRWMRAACADDTAGLLGEVFEVVGGPLDFDGVVAAVATLSGTGQEGRRDESPTLASLPDRTAEPADVILDRRRLMEALWQEIRALPLRQRVALLLNLRDATGAGLLWVFPMAGVATMRQIARTLAIPDAELAELWGKLPVPDQVIADRLGRTRQQVINLRAVARKRLFHRLGANMPFHSASPVAGTHRAGAGDRREAPKGSSLR